MNSSFRIFAAFAFALVFALPLLSTPASAEDRNGLRVLVTKTTLDKKDVRDTSGSSSGYYEKTSKTQGLKVAVKNISFKPMPEGEMTWKILVVGSYSSVLYSGVEKVNSLKPAEGQDLIIGAAQVSAWKDYSGRGGDKTEYQIAINHGAKEIVKLQSTPGFDALAKRATPAASASPSTGPN